MPIIKSAKKRMRQNIKRAERNKVTRSKMRGAIKRVFIAIKEKKVDELEKLVTEAYSKIDTAAKKNVIHANNAARKKARVQRAFNSLQK